MAVLLIDAKSREGSHLNGVGIYPTETTLLSLQDSVVEEKTLENKDNACMEICVFTQDLVKLWFFHHEGFVEGGLKMQWEAICCVVMRRKFR
ncbi:hypothetical protein H5410_029460 [Solanum commersonii]|uniref:Uncharacterized protein n=1 Tax=Solanum commersonii TaxID=4109 RepID=A0A9J5Z7R2_SOLCO|nr:hypothetical protein H5410_029460 [Solanum commersonii]